MIVLLSGGVGGAKVAEGLAGILPARELAVIVNTGDDLEWFGLSVCPDLDIVMYTLANIVNRETGWGVAEDSFGAVEMLSKYGEPAWFRLGDRDLATALLRAGSLRAGISLTEATARLCRALGVEAQLVPMSNDPVRTRVQTPEGELEFQEYFVARAARSEVLSVRFAGAERARPSPAVLSVLQRADAVIFAPSNPIVSIGPILSVAGIREAIRLSPGIKIGVSPLIAGQALKGPAATMMRSLGHRPDAAGVAELFRDLLDVFVIDVADAGLAPDVRELGMAVEIRQTVMTSAEDKRRVAGELLNIARQVRR